MPDKIVFLGTGGGRIVSFLQARATGGIIFNINNTQIHLDPGPGAIIRARQFGLNPGKTDVVILSHCHTDHVNDAVICMEAMAGGNIKKNGVLISNKTCVFGYNETFEPVIPSYIKRNLSELYVLEPGGEIEIKGIKITATKTIHEDPNGVGFKFSFGDKKISYVSDTEYSDEIMEQHKDSDILILNVLRPGNEKISGHLCSEDAIKFLRKTIPGTAIIQHFGMKMLNVSPMLEARRIQKESGVRCICAKDGMLLDVNVLISEGKQKKLTVY